MTEMRFLILSWRRCVLLILLGGLIGCGVATVLPKSYTAKATLSSSIDYSQTGTLDDLSQDRMLSIAEDILNSNTVIINLCENFEDCTPESFRAKATIARTNDRWLLTVSDNDPQIAGLMSLSWLKNASNALRTAQTHAYIANSLERKADALSSCIQTALDPYWASACPQLSVAQLFDQIQTISHEILREKTLSKGLPVGLNFSEPDYSAISVFPTGQNTAFLTLCGAMCGCLSALLWAWLAKKQNPAE